MIGLILLISRLQTDIIQIKLILVTPSIDKNNYSVRPMVEQDVRAILLWRYDEPYNFYNPPQQHEADHYVRQFLDPELMFHAVVDPADTLSGFCSYGTDGQVSGGDYSEDALDVGLGMKPELTGQGRGKEFFQTILEHSTTFSPAKVRLTVATFNQRAMCLYKHFGFEEDAQFFDTQSYVHYTILVRNY